MQLRAKIAIVNPASERNPEKARGDGEIYPRLFSCLIVFQFPDRDLAKENCLTLCLFGFTITAHFGKTKHTLLQTDDHKLKE